MTPPRLQRRPNMIIGQSQSAAHTHSKNYTRITKINFCMTFKDVKLKVSVTKSFKNSMWITDRVVPPKVVKYYQKVPNSEFWKKSSLIFTILVENSPKLL